MYALWTMLHIGAGAFTVTQYIRAAPWRCVYTGIRSIDIRRFHKLYRPNKYSPFSHTSISSMNDISTTTQVLLLHDKTMRALVICSRNCALPNSHPLLVFSALFCELSITCVACYQKTTQSTMAWGSFIWNVSVRFEIVGKVFTRFCGRRQAEVILTFPTRSGWRILFFRVSSACVDVHQASVSHTYEPARQSNPFSSGICCFSQSFPLPGSVG